MRLKQFDKAIEDFNQAIDLNSKYSSAYHNKGQALSGLGRHDKAVEEFSKVIEMNPDSPLLLKDRGTAYYKLGEYELAKNDFEKSIELDKRSAPAYAGLALLYASAKDEKFRNPQLARRNSEKAISVAGPLAPEIYRNHAEVMRELNQNQEAVSALHKAASLDPSNKEVQELMSKWGITNQKVAEQKAPVKENPFSSLW